MSTQSTLLSKIQPLSLTILVSGAFATQDLVDINHGYTQLAVWNFCSITSPKSTQREAPLFHVADPYLTTSSFLTLKQRARQVWKCRGPQPAVYRNLVSFLHLTQIYNTHEKCSAVALQQGRAVVAFSSPLLSHAARVPTSRYEPHSSIFPNTNWFGSKWVTGLPPSSINPHKIPPEVILIDMGLLFSI